MSPSQRQNISNFTIGRERIGQIQFNAPVNLSNVNLDSIFNNLVRDCVVGWDVVSVTSESLLISKGNNE
jgi:nuclear pore complex protein Nup98-Nup96